MSTSPPLRHEHHPTAQARASPHRSGTSPTQPVRLRAQPHHVGYVQPRTPQAVLTSHAPQGEPRLSGLQAAALRTNHGPQYVKPRTAATHRASPPPSYERAMRGLWIRTVGGVCFHIIPVPLPPDTGEPRSAPGPGLQDVPTTSSHLPPSHRPQAS